MENRCHNCGYGNEQYASKCAKCGISFEHELSSKKESMKHIKTFSILYLASSLIGSGEFVYQYLIYGQFSYGIFSAVPPVSQGQIQNLVTSLLYTVTIIAVISALLTLASVIYLRKSYRILLASDRDFSSSVTGTTLIFIGLVLVIVSIPIMVVLVLSILPGIVQTNPVFSSASLSGLIGALSLFAVGALLLFIGIILGVILGIHKLSVKFEESMFEASWIFFLISMFFSPFGIVASLLSYSGGNRTIKYLEESLSMQI